MISIVLIYLGKVPTYTRSCVQQIKTWAPETKIYFITDNLQNAKDILNDYDINYVDSSSLKSTMIQDIEAKRGKFSVCNWVQNREHLFYFSMLRFYLLEEWMRQTGIQDVFHLEVDNLIYYDPNEFIKQFRTRGVSYLYEDASRGCASVFYARDVDAMQHMNKTILTYISDKDFNNEMTFIGRYADEHPDRVYILPHIPPADNGTTVEKIASNFQNFGGEWIFDSMSIGMWLTGIDKIHSNGMLKREKSRWIPLDFTKFKFEWKLNRKEKLYPVMITPNHTCRIFNLHVHSKDLKPYLSYKFNLPNNKRLINGEVFQDECDLFIDVADDDKGWIPKWEHDPRHRYLKDIPDNFDNPKYIYIRGWQLNNINEILRKFKNPFVLVAHNADEWIKNNQGMVNVIQHPKIIKFFSQNLILNYPKAQFLPIGLANTHWPHGNQEIFLKYMNRKQNNVPFVTTSKKDIFFNFSIETAPWYRQDCYDKCKAKGLEWVENKPYEEYLQTLSTYKFAISPLGNGFDCHRIWECVYLGVIPIVMYHPFIEVLRKTVKMVILRDWSELDPENLPIYLPEVDMIYAEDYIKMIKEN